MRASDKVSVAVGAPRSTRKPLSFDHMTTLGFFQIQPMMYHEMVVDEKIKGEAVSFTRSFPMVSPVMTSIKYNYSKFFVRYKDVWPAWDDFDAKAIHYFSADSVNAIPSQVPFVKNNEFVKYFISAQTAGGTPLLCQLDNGSNTDFVYYDGSNSTGYTYTDRGRYVMKILNSFGIIIHWNSAVSVKISLLPLLCYAKCYCDWFVPNQYVNSNTGIRQMQNVFVTDTNASEALPDSSPTKPYSVFLILFCSCPFYSTFDDNDLYSAWDNVSGPGVVSSIGNITVPDISNNAISHHLVTNDSASAFSPTSITAKPTNGTPFVGGTQQSNSTIAAGVVTQFVLDSLRHVTNVVRRAQLVGERTVDRFLAKYGVKLKDDHRSMLLGQETQYLNIGDVEATADSTDGSVYSNVGDLAGKGVTLGKVQYDAAAGSHAGLFMILCTTIPDASLVQGFDPMWLHVEPDQFYNPDFDHLGTDAIPHMAVFVPIEGSNADSPLGVYGYLPRYYEYLLNRTLLTGSFTNHLGAAELSSYHTYRLIPEQAQSNIVHSLDFVTPNMTSIGLLQRIYYTLGAYDTFILHFKSTFVSNSSKRPLKDVYDWGDDEKNGMLDLQSTNAKVH